MSNEQRILFLAGLAESFAPSNERGRWAWSELSEETAEMIWRDLSAGIPAAMIEAIEGGGYDHGLEAGSKEGIAHLKQVMREMRAFNLI